MRPYGRARISASHPQALGVCDRCGFTHNLVDLRWQFQYAGTQLQNLRYLVCSSCLDEPNQQLRTILIPPDPLPVLNPRPENYAVTAPNYLFTEDGDILMTEDGDLLVTEDELPQLYPDQS